jgi:hypothetical protein
MREQAASEVFRKLHIYLFLDFPDYPEYRVSTVNYWVWVGDLRDRRLLWRRLKMSQ